MGKRGKNKDNKDPNLFIDLFAGCGGLSLGLMLAGWKGLFAIEGNRDAFETLSHNLINGNRDMCYEWPYWLPKKAYEINAFIKEYRSQISKLRNKVLLIAGGPPCQGFSLYGKRNKTDPRNWLFRHYLDIIKLVKPSFILLENVRGIDVEFGKKRRQTTNKNGVGRPPKSFSKLIKECLEGDYEIHAGLIKAVDFGVPQLRPRYIMLGIDRNLLKGNNTQIDPFELIEDYRLSFLNEKKLPIDRPVNVKEAISDLETHGKALIDCVDSPRFKQIDYDSPQTYYQELLHGNLNGVAPNSLRLPKHRDKTVKRFSTILNTCRRGVQLSQEDRERLGIKKQRIVALNEKRPSHTITTLPDDILHYSEPRILTVRESARLQSFPDWFAFKGNYTTGGHRRVKDCPRYTQVGNAVPPFIAEILGKVVSEMTERLLPTN